MAVGFPVKDNFVDGDVYSAADVNDLAGTVNLVPQIPHPFLLMGA